MLQNKSYETKKKKKNSRRGENEPLTKGRYSATWFVLSWQGKGRECEEKNRAAFALAVTVEKRLGMAVTSTFHNDAMKQMFLVEM